MNKYLFMLDELPPTRSANGICVEKVMACLSESEEVFCVTWDDAEKTQKKLFHCTNIPKKPWHRFVAKHQGKNGSIIFAIARVVYWVKRMFLLPIWPVDSLTCVYHFYASAKKLIEEHNITHVIAVSYPGETLLAMCMLKRRFKTQLLTVMYPLDVTLAGMNRGGILERRLSCVFGRRFMKKCAQHADQVLVLENAQNLYNQVFTEEERENFSCCGIPLLEEIDWAQCSTDISVNDEDIHFVFGGNLLYSMRNPTRLLDVIEKAPWPVESRIYFDLYGKADEQLQELWKGRYNRLKIIDHGWVDETVLNAALLSANVLISLGNNRCHLIPSKLFKYMAIGKPIIHLCFSEQDPCKPYLNRYGNALILDADCLESQEITKFTLNCETEHVEISRMFPSCTPQYTAELIRKGGAKLDCGNQEQGKKNN